jgi:hypothetical protein
MITFSPATESIFTERVVLVTMLAAKLTEAELPVAYVESAAQRMTKTPVTASVEIAKNLFPIYY